MVFIRLPGGGVDGCLLDSQGWGGWVFIRLPGVGWLVLIRLPGGGVAGVY